MMFNTRILLLLVLAALVHHITADEDDYEPAELDFTDDEPSLDEVVVNDVIGQTVPESANDEPETRTIVSVQIGDTTITAPVYEMTDKPFTEARLALDRALMTNMMAIIQDLGSNIILKNKRIIIHGFKAIVKLMWMGRNHDGKSKELDKTDVSPRYNPDYLSKMSSMLLGILRSRSDIHPTKEEAYERYRIATEGVKQIVMASNTGIYVDWAKMKIDGVTLLDYTAPLIQWFHDNGKGTLVNKAESLASLIANCKGNDDKNKDKKQETNPDEVD